MPKLAGSLNKYGFGQADNVWDVDGICLTILTGGDKIGHQINVLTRGSGIPFGGSWAEEGDCVALTFGKNGKCHTPVMKGNCKTITTMSERDIGMVVRRDMGSECIGLIPLEAMKAHESDRRVYTQEGEAASILCRDAHSANYATICLNPKVDGKQPMQKDRVYSEGGVSTAITTDPFFMGNIREQSMGRLRIRKLTEGECMRLMGFEGKDTEACRKAGLTKTNIYHQSGDSIVTAVLMGIFGELFDPDYRNKIEDYCEKLAKEKTP